MQVTSSKVIFIPKGSTNSTINYLNSTGFDLNVIDKMIIKFNGYPQSGWIDLKANFMTKADFLNRLLKSKAALKSVTLIPGETYYFFFKEIAEKFNLSHQKLLNSYEKYAYKLDGNILAESYSLPIGMNEDHIVYYLINFTENKYKEFSTKIFGEYNKKTWYKYVTIASIIQKEAANVDEMPIVSSVIQNRLKKKMALQMDGTLNYGIYSHNVVTPKMIREDTTSYNTYKYNELPKDPVCAVSLEAIKAAIFPAKTDYLYFYRNKKTGLHDFASDYKTHVNNINLGKKYKEPKKDITTTPKPVFEKKEDNKSSKDIKSLFKNIQ